MAYAIELYFDEESTQRVTALTRVVYQNCGGVDLLGLGFRPHISLAGYEHADALALAPALEKFAAHTLPLPIALSAIGVFPTSQGVVYLAPVVTPVLLHLHASWSRQAETLGYLAHPYYRPGAWIPHCTIAGELAPEQIGNAVHLCLRSDAFGNSRLVAVGLIEHRPVNTLAYFMLTGAE